MADGPTSGTPRTEADLLANSFQDGQANNSITAQDMRDLVVSIPQWIENGGGWEFVYDTTTSLGPLVDETPTIVPISPNVGETLQFPAGFQIWDSANNKILPPSLNSFGIVRLSFTGVYASGGTAPHIDVWLDVGATPLSLANVIYKESAVFAKGAAEAQYFNFIVPLFAGADFLANGGTFVVQAHGSSVITLNNFSLTSARMFNPTPTA